MIIAGRYGVRTPGYNHIEVFSTMDPYGIPVFGDEVDYEEINLVGHRLQKIFDYAYDTNDECHSTAGRLLSLSPSWRRLVPSWLSSLSEQTSVSAIPTRRPWRSTEEPPPTGQIKAGALSWRRTERGIGL